MTSDPGTARRRRWLAQGLAIGVAGGLAEVLVVGAGARVAGVDATAVAVAIAQAVRLEPASAGAGLAVHMALSALLGIVLLAVVDGGRSALSAYGRGLVALAAVWSLNFLVVLPVLSPGFVHLLPQGVTLASKLMFALAAVATSRALAAAGAPRPGGVPSAAGAAAWRRQRTRAA